MVPTIKTGQLIFAKKIDQKSLRKIVKRWDVVLFALKNNKLVKRVVGLPNDEITITDGKVIINDEIAIISPRLVEFYRHLNFYGKCSNDEYLVLGDNILDSYDSRKFGSIKEGQLIGIVKFKLWPPKKID